jgi:hypothetical protein
MAVITGQVSSTSSPALSTTVVALLVTVPAGPQTFVVSNVSGATVFIGPPAPGNQVPTATALMASGFPIANGSTSSVVRDHQAASSTPMYVIAITGGSLSGPVGWMISTDG